MAEVAKKNEQPPDPPKAIEIKRRVAFNRTQAIGVSLLLVLPVLGLLQVFDTSMSSSQASQDGLDVKVQYPSRLRDRNQDPLVASVGNSTGSDIPLLEVEVSKDYLRHFEQAEFDPQPDEVREDSMVFQLKEVKSGETRQILSFLESDEAGPHQGWIRVMRGDQEGPEVNFSTFVLP